MGIKKYFNDIKEYALYYYHKLKHAIEFFRDQYSRIKDRTIPLSLSAPKPVAHWMLWTTLIFTIIFFLWAKFAVLEEVTVAQATVIPLSHVQTIQNMEGGIVKKILVHEGDIVQADQVLMYLDPTRFISSLDESKTRINSLKLKIARLTAEVENKPFKVDPQLEKSTPNLYLNEIALYQARQKQLREMQNNYALAKKELNMTQPLVKEGAASQVEALRLERESLGLKNQIDEFYSRSLGELQAAKGDLEALNASMMAIQDRLDRTTIRSPVKGIVKQIRTPTQGGVIMPGTEIMSVVPLEDVLLVEAQVKPSDIGFIHPGEKAMVKITAYDYAIYGGLPGEVDAISADTITNEKGESYYLVRVKTHTNYLHTERGKLYIIPGMTATVSILTGKKTVLDYILSPLLKAKESALRER